MESYLLGFLGFVVGVFVVKLVDHLLFQTKREMARVEAEKVSQEARLKAENLFTEAKLKCNEEIQALRKSVENELAEKRSKVEQSVHQMDLEQEKKAKAQGEKLAKLEKELEKDRIRLEGQNKDVQKLERRLESELERVGEFSKEKAKEQLLARMEQELEFELAKRVRDYEARFKEDSKRRALRVLSQAVHRCSVDFASESLVTVVPLPTDEMKGRIIGREGRNIRAFESLTGVNVIVDDTPEAVVLSAFNPIKREIARLTMEQMIVDGRIHPAKIEQIYEQCQKELYQTIREIGEESVLKLGLTGIHDKMVFEIGKMKYRSSYGQNLLEHSFEVANIASTIAAEMGADMETTKRSAFLHDIGKVIDTELEGPHAIIGGEIAERLGEKHKVVNAIAAHHEEVEQETAEATIVQVADTLSASRPGARRSTLDSYIKRLEHMESIAREFRGVIHAYAIQAGREIRIMVRPGEVDDDMCAKLARDIVKKIEDNMEYPGQVKVVVTRETRAVDIAK